MKKHQSLIKGIYITLFLLILFYQVQSQIPNTYRCHSSCGDCDSGQIQINQCKVCSSHVLRYLPFTNSAKQSCQLDHSYSNTQTWQEYMVVDKSTLLGGDKLNVLTWDTIPISINQIGYPQSLGSLGYMSQTSNQFIMINQVYAPYMQLEISGLGQDHCSIYIRFNVMNIITDLDTSFHYSIDAVQCFDQWKQLDNGTYYFVQSPPMQHFYDSVAILFNWSQSWGIFEELRISDISIYILKCLPGCVQCRPTYPTGNLDIPFPMCSRCDQFGSYTWGPNMQCILISCLNNGFNVSNVCVQFQLCHSTCGTCSVKRNPNSCTSCSSQFINSYSASLPDDRSPGPCSLQSNGNTFLLMNVDHTYVIGSSYIKAVYYKVYIQKKPVSLGSIIYNNHLLDYSKYTHFPLSMIFYFEGVTSVHKMIVARIRVSTTCTSTQTISAIIDTNPSQSKSFTTNDGQVIFQASGKSMTQKFQFNLTWTRTSNTENCRQFLQDLTFFYQKCYPYCQSSDCPSTAIYFKDPSASRCIETCPDGLLGDTTTGLCVVTCPNGYYNDTSIKLCVSKCPNSYFADANTNLCVNSCPPNYFGDLLTNLCVSKCPYQYYGNSITKTCIPSSSCPNTYYGDSTTNLCITPCPATYSVDSTSKLCVCSNSYFSDTLSKTCVSTCPNTYFLDVATNICLNPCPTNLFGDSTSKQCVSATSCSNGYFGDPITQKCVSTCPSTYFIDSATKICVKPCPINFFADEVTNLCVSASSCSNNYFSDITTKTCVLICPSWYFADPTTKKCVQTCPTNYFSDQPTKKCVLATSCSSIYSFGDTTTQRCVSSCPSTTFIDNTAKTCVNPCPTNYFGDSGSKQCVSAKGCSNSYAADPTTQKCVPTCPSTYFLNIVTNICVNPCPTNYFGDSSTKKCVSATACPTNYFGDPTTQTCVSTCPSTYFINTATKMCVNPCPTNLFGDSGTKKCVAATSCPTNYFGDTTTQLCVNPCPTNYFGDSGTKKCVAATSCPSNYFGDTTAQICVNPCPTNYFGDSSTKKCVTATSCPNNYFGDTTTQLCVNPCPTNYFGDSSTKKCVAATSCPNNYFGDTTTQRCVNPCPTNYFGDSSTKKCVAATSCPTNYFGDTTAQICVNPCPTNYFGDSSNKICVSATSCSNNYFGDISTQKCVPTCPSNYFGDNITKICGTGCTNPYFKDPLNNMCVTDCPTNYYGVQSTYECVGVCPFGYYGNSTSKFCQLYEFCNSQCQTCTIKNNQQKCDTCSSSTISSFLSPVPSISSPNKCLPSSTNKWQLFFKINKQTAIIDKTAPSVNGSYLYQVFYNSVLHNNIAVGTKLKQFVYSQNVLDFSSLTNNNITFYFSNIAQTYYRIYARIKVYTQCSTAQNRQFTVYVQNNQVKNIVINPNVETIVETTPIDFSMNQFLININFGLSTQNCRKIIQDIAVYKQICPVHCDSCTDGGAIKQYNSNACLLTCGTDQVAILSGGVNQCQKCASPCIECKETTTNCTKCGVINSVKYYLVITSSGSVNTGSCSTQCPSLYFPDDILFTCKTCDIGCGTCTFSTSNCSSCVKVGIVDYYLQPTNGCQTNCPSGYYPNSNTRICVKCDSRCAVCTGPLNTDCSTCRMNEQNIYYYLQPSSTTCEDKCPDSYYGDKTQFKCILCDTNCLSCDIASNKCTSCKPITQLSPNSSPYLEDNSCVKVCQSLRFLYQNKCWQVCPEGTKGGIKDDNKTLICIPCDGPCVKTTFNMQTVVINDGKKLKHQVKFQNGLNSNNTVDSLKTSMKMYLVVQEKRLLLENNEDTVKNEDTYSKRRLQLKFQLLVEYLQISSDFNSLTVNTPNPFGELTLQQIIKSRVQIVFTTPVLDRKGVPYTQTSSNFSLDQKKFIQSYFQQLGNEKYMYVGIALCGLAGIILLLSIFCISDKKVAHEIMAFIMTIQIVGLIRMRAYKFPYIDLSWILYGFSKIQFDYVPNGLTYLYPNGYVQNIFTSVGLTYDNQSLFTTWGSTFQVFIALEILLGIYILESKVNSIKQKKSQAQNDEKWQKIKFFQHQILALVLVKSVFSSILCLTSYKINGKTDQMPKIFWFAELSSIFVLTFFMIYLIKHSVIPKAKKPKHKHNISSILDAPSGTHAKIKPQEQSQNQIKSRINIEHIRIHSQDNLTMNIKESRIQLNNSNQKGFSNFGQENQQNSLKAKIKERFQPNILYKLYNFLRVICVILVVVDKNFLGIIILNAVQLIAFLIQIYFFRQDRYNLRLYIVDFCLTIVAFNVACIVEKDTILLLTLLAAALYGLFFIKTYYIITAYLSSYKQKYQKRVEGQNNSKHQNFNDSNQMINSVKVIPIKSFYEQVESLQSRGNRPEKKLKQPVNYSNQNQILSQLQICDYDYTANRNYNKNNDYVTSSRLYKQKKDLNSVYEKHLKNIHYKMQSQSQSQNASQRIVYDGKQFSQKDIFKMTSMLKQGKSMPKKEFNMTINNFNQQNHHNQLEQMEQIDINNTKPAHNQQKFNNTRRDNNQQKQNNTRSDYIQQKQQKQPRKQKQQKQLFFEQQIPQQIQFEQQIKQDVIYHPAPAVHTNKTNKGSNRKLQVIFAQQQDQNNFDF